MSDNPVLRYWPIIAFVATGLVGYGVTQNQINSNEKDIADNDLIGGAYYRYHHMS